MVGPMWGPKRMDEWADAHLAEYKVPVSDRAWSTLLRVLQQLGWAALAQCKMVWKVFCRLRAGEDEATAVAAKQVAARARQQRWRETEPQRLGLRATKRAKAAADKEKARRLRLILDPTRPDRPKGWTRRLTDRAVLHWGAKRELIKRLTTVSAKTAQVAVVIATARASLSRVQTKRNRRYALRLEARAGVKPPEHAPGPGSQHGLREGGGIEAP